jgi:hypothetical protein
MNQQSFQINNALSHSRLPPPQFCARSRRHSFAALAIIALVGFIVLNQNDGSDAKVRHHKSTSVKDAERASALSEHNNIMEKNVDDDDEGSAETELEHSETSSDVSGDEMLQDREEADVSKMCDLNLLAFGAGWWFNHLFCLVLTLSTSFIPDYFLYFVFFANAFELCQFTWFFVDMHQTIVLLSSNELK